MALGERETARLCPASVAVEDDGDATSDIEKFEVGGDLRPP
jgi:hypothetical protein